jgi:hypothetical protein
MIFSCHQCRNFPTRWAIYKPKHSTDGSWSLQVGASRSWTKRALVLSLAGDGQAMEKGGFWINRATCLGYTYLSRT